LQDPSCSSQPGAPSLTGAPGSSKQIHSTRNLWIYVLKLRERATRVNIGRRVFRRLSDHRHHQRRNQGEDTRSRAVRGRARLNRMTSPIPSSSESQAGACDSR
jgi:hypothetical protein